jgi:DNA-binding transcriptional ArsR family regulator
MASNSKKPTLIWEHGTGYDFFISLQVLHHPNKFALRGAWAKGVRARLPGKARRFLEDASSMFLKWLPWVHRLPAPRDADTILRELAAIPAENRLMALSESVEIPGDLLNALQQVALQGSWTEAERVEIGSLARAAYHPGISQEGVEEMLGLWARGAAFGEQALSAFQAYYDVFFAEEEQRIRPALEQAVARGKSLADEMNLPDLLAELSEGIRFDRLPDTEKLIMIPSYWIAPLITMTQADEAENLFVFGGRPEEASLVPGQAVPDALFRTLKALADPTRLRILHYLVEEPQTPTELARRLRLRAPTVIHHLNTLRLAGLIFVTFEGKADKAYAARLTRVSEMYGQLRSFLEGPQPAVEVPSELRDIRELPPQML